MIRFLEIVRATADFIDRYSLIILLFASPLFLFPSPDRAFSLLLIPFLWIARTIAGKKAVFRTPLDGVFFVLIAMVGVSIWATPDIEFSLGKIVGLLFGVTLFYSLARWLNSAEKLWVGIHCFVFSGVALSVLSLLGTNWIHKFSFLGIIANKLPRIIVGLDGAEGGFSANAVGGILVLFIPMQIVLVRYYYLSRNRSEWRNRGFSAERSRSSNPAHAAKDSQSEGVLSEDSADSPEGGVDRFVAEFLKRKRTWLTMLYSHIGLLGLTLFVLVLSQSRSAWIGLGSGFLTLLMFFGKRGRIVCLGLLLAGLLGGVLIGPSKLKTVSVEHSGAGSLSSVQGRLELWSRAVYAIQDFPFTGMGMNMFRRVMPILYPTFLTPPDFDVSNAHNHLLQAALDLGLPGLIAYLAIWWGAAYMLVAVFRRTQNAWLRTVSQGLCAGLISYFVFQIGDCVALGAKVGVFFWIVLSLVVGTFLRANRDSDSA